MGKRQPTHPQRVPLETRETSPSCGRFAKTDSGRLHLMLLLFFYAQECRSSTATRSRWHTSRAALPCSVWKTSAAPSTAVRRRAHTQHLLPCFVCCFSHEAMRSDSRLPRQARDDRSESSRKKRLWLLCRGGSSGRQRGKETRLFTPFYTKNVRFTKTGSGQTRGKLQKRTRFCRAP
eukprot:COSAG06_NODE_3067_length_5897_cov_5.614005_8_plen_177_part_00